MPGHDLRSAEGSFPVRLLCGKCHLLMREPVQMPDGERMCKSCLETNTSPRSLELQRRDCTQCFPDRAIEKEILQCMVKCRNVSNCCPWEGRLEDLEDHEAHECQYRSLLGEMDEINEEVFRTTVQGLRKRAKTLRNKLSHRDNMLSQQEEQLQRDNIIVQQGLMLFPVPLCEPHLQGTCTSDLVISDVTTNPQQAECENSGVSEMTIEYRDDTDPIDYHQIRASIMETANTFEENGAMIREGNKDNTQFMMEAAAIFKCVTPTRKK